MLEMVALNFYGEVNDRQLEICMSGAEAVPLPGPVAIPKRE